MRQLTIHDQGQPIYPIYLTDDFASLGKAVSALNLKGRKICIVSESHVAPLYLDTVKANLAPVCGLVTSFVFEAGEGRKNLDTVQDLYEHLVEEHYERGDVLAALGGGVTGDLTGFAAATYMRGMRFIQIPTSLLAQVDSSIGGKTGVDFRACKNMVGAFHHPSLVYANVQTLHSLTEREYISGLGEIIKHGLIKDKAYYEWLKANREAILAQDPSVMTEMIFRSCKIKQEVVENDPREQGERALLNFGHTLGHAIEKLKDFSLLHGECVAIGMTGAARLSASRSMISASDLEEIVQTLQDFKLPVRTDRLTAEITAETTLSDKKMNKGRIRFILLESIGRAVIRDDLTMDEITDAAAFCLVKGAEEDR